MKINFDERINRKDTFCEKWDGQGGDYLAMWVADMDFRTPEQILNAMKERIEHGVFGYTGYEGQLADVVVDYYKKYYDYEIKPEWIVWTAGVMPGSNIACRIKNGDILYQTPMYSHIRLLGEEVHKKNIEVPLRCEGDMHYSFDMEALEQAVTPETTTFILCNPHNPVGRVYTREELEKVVDFCEKHDLLLISDEIHSQIILEGEHIPAFTLNEKARQRTITFTSAAKTYNIPSLPFAFAIIPNEELRNRFLDCASGLIPSANPLTVAAVKSAYTECEEWRQELLTYLRGNRDYMVERISRMQGISMAPMQATYLAWLDVRALGLETPWQFFREKAGVNFSDGKEFAGEGFLRVNIGCPREQLKEALDLMEQALKQR